MNMGITMFVSVVAGLGAGVGTGLAGLSAAAVIAPMLITFLQFAPYEAIGIALASDVLASAVSAYTYGKSGHLDVKNGLVMLGAVLVSTLVGSWASSFIPGGAMGGFSVFTTLLVGLKFIFRPVMSTTNRMEGLTLWQRTLRALLCGTVIGLICGTVGAGGGMMMLLILTSVLGYELKTAVGTSVFIMAFTALTGAASHFVIGGMPDLFVLVVCVVATLVGARLAALFANCMDAKKLNRATGVVLAALGLAMILVKFILP